MLFSLLLCICISSFLLSTNHGYRRLVSPSSISSASAGNSNCCFHSNKFKIGLNSDEIDTSSPKVKPEYVKDLTQTLRWFSAAGIFACFIAATKGAPAAIDFCSGYLLEQCLSVDNLFVILLIFEYFGVERKDQGRALQYGLFGAMLLRGIFITLGSAILTEYHQVLLLFAGILLYSSYNILFCSDDQSQTDVSKNPLITFATKYFKTSDKMDGQKFFSVVDGVWTATPYLLCTICIELSDVIFAVDSVPAIFGITTDPFIVFSSNIFAIAGLRSLFGVLSQAMSDLVYLEQTVGVILGLIAIKMGVESVGYHLLSPLQSLLLVVGILGTGVARSLSKKMSTKQ